MTATIKSQIQEVMKAAMKNQEPQKRDACRLILNAFKQVEVDERIELNHDQELALLAKMVKQRQESKAEYEKISRLELAEKEQYEIDIIQSFMPAPLSENEIEQLIQAAMSETQAKSVQEMSKVMAIVKPKVIGRADIGKIGARIKELLA